MRRHHALRPAGFPCRRPAPFRVRRGGAARRPAASLTELMVVISLLGAALSMLAVVLHGAGRVETTSRQWSRMTDGLSRWAPRFREDAHAASTWHRQTRPLVAAGENAAPGETGSAPRVMLDALVFSAPGQPDRVHALAPGEIQRWVERDGRRQQLEIVPLPPSLAARWRLEGEPPRRVALELLRREQPVGAFPGADGAESAASPGEAALHDARPWCIIAAEKRAVDVSPAPAAVQPAP